MKVFPDNLLGLWIDEDNRAVFIFKNESQYQTSIFFNIKEQLKKRKLKIENHLANLTTNWVLDEERNVYRFQIEVGLEFIGPTYNLYISGINEEPTDLKNDSTLMEQLKLLPEVQMGLYDDWDDDFGVPWAFPYKNYERASGKLENIFKELLLSD
ncbi:MAG: hypothetical protein FK734_14220 [Asgard group archaeon]|nr:hypothetical protein [Asgard group archaeon]